jgi:ABC-type bacteriocin/lantibiotic exporter with double-glycine peptidase domain
LKQDGEFYDQLNHSTGHLTNRLNSDAPNVQSAIDQRLADTLQGFVALISGISIAFAVSTTMAPIGLISPMFIVCAQIILLFVVRRRMHKDLKIAEEASRIASESIEYVRTVQALTRESFFCKSNIQVI